MTQVSTEKLQELYQTVTTGAFVGRKRHDTISADMVRKIRKAAGLTQDKLALELGLTGGKGTVSAWETGRAKCTGISAVALTLAVEDMLRQWDSMPRLEGIKSATVSVSHLEMLAVSHIQSPFEVAASRLPKNVDIVFIKRILSDSDKYVFQVAYRELKT